MMQKNTKEWKMPSLTPIRENCLEFLKTKPSSHCTVMSRCFISNLSYIIGPSDDETIKPLSQCIMLKIVGFKVKLNIEFITSNSKSKWNLIILLSTTLHDDIIMAL